MVQAEKGAVRVDMGCTHRPVSVDRALAFARPTAVPCRAELDRPTTGRKKRSGGRFQFGMSRHTTFLV